MKNWRLLVNIGLFQLGWFACILLSGYWPMSVTALLIALHFSLVVTSAQRMTEAQLLLCVLVVGFVLESVYLWLGVLVHVNGSSVPPIWLLCIWVLFASTFRHSLLWLKPKPLLAAIFAGVSAPLSYYAGANLNADMSLNETVLISILGVAVSWAIVFPFMLRYFLPINTSSSLAE